MRWHRPALAAGGPERVVVPAATAPGCGRRGGIVEGLLLVAEAAAQHLQQGVSRRCLIAHGAGVSEALADFRLINPVTVARANMASRANPRVRLAP